MKGLKTASVGLALAAIAFSCFATGAAAKKTSKNTVRTRIYNSMVVTAIDSNSTDGLLTLTATKNGTTYTIDATDTNAKRIVRRNNAKAAFSEIMRNDNLKVWGTLDSTTNTITATKIRDNSIYKLGSSLKGTIDTPITGILNPTDGTTLYQFTLLTRNRGRQFVETLSTTPIKYRGQSKTFADLHTGDSIEIKGLWNKTNSKIYNTTRIKITRFATPTP